MTKRLMTESHKVTIPSKLNKNARGENKIVDTLTMKENKEIVQENVSRTTYVSEEETKVSSEAFIQFLHMQFVESKNSSKQETE